MVLTPPKCPVCDGTGKLWIGAENQWYSEPCQCVKENEYLRTRVQELEYARAEEPASPVPPDEIEKFKAERDAAQEACDANARVCGEELLARRAAEARIAELEAGLRPFAEAAWTLDAKNPDAPDSVYVNGITLGECRRARALLRETKP